MSKKFLTLIILLISANMIWAQGNITRNKPKENTQKTAPPKKSTPKKTPSKSVAKETPSSSVTRSSGSINGHDYVDLGLSVKWATCNIGATTPEGYGDYYAWGETVTKNTYSWSNYKWCNGSGHYMTKYCIPSSYGTYGKVDNKETVELSDDVAHVKWGDSWRMPTRAEQNELCKNCTCTWTTRNGVKGYVLKSKKNGNSIFLPAAGGRNGNELNNVGAHGCYWSSSLSWGYAYSASYLYFYSSDVGGRSGDRNMGYSVRAVCP